MALCSEVRKQRNKKKKELGSFSQSTDGSLLSGRWQGVMGRNGARRGERVVAFGKEVQGARGTVTPRAAPSLPRWALAGPLVDMLGSHGNRDVTVGRGWGGTDTSSGDTGGDNCLGNICK